MYYTIGDYIVLFFIIREDTPPLYCRRLIRYKLGFPNIKVGPIKILYRNIGVDLYWF